MKNTKITIKYIKGYLEVIGKITEENKLYISIYTDEGDIYYVYFFNILRIKKEE
jgi:hypothetical protein